MDLSNREKEIWIELVVSMAVAIYYFTNAYNAGALFNIVNAELGKVVVNAIILSITSTIVLSIVFKQKSTEAKDERDIAIESKANSYSYYGLCVFITIIIGHIMISEGIGYFDNETPVSLDSSAIMHLLLVSMIVAGAIKSVTQIIHYRYGG
tara:strand:- start:49464 stop:49919 length:456 start_codon:yes stop_codon:yes gene_type:complete